jgi:hypothetical protein
MCHLVFLWEVLLFYLPKVQLGSVPHQIFIQRVHHHNYLLGLHFLQEMHIHPHLMEYFPPSYSLLLMQQQP